MLDVKRVDILFSFVSLQLDVVLNGLGKWKGRNLLSCLTVVKGEFDALLPWPCNLKADIILRNQSRDSASVGLQNETDFVAKQTHTIHILSF